MPMLERETRASVEGYTRLPEDVVELSIVRVVIHVEEGAEAETTGTGKCAGYGALWRSNLGERNS